MRRVGLFCVVVLFGTAFQCETTPSVGSEGEGQTESCLKKDWFTSILNGLKNNTEVKSEIISYTYHGQTVYYIDSCVGCPDSMALVYTCSGEVICQFGGIAGFNTCPDFQNFATHKKIIWSN